MSEQILNSTSTQLGYTVPLITLYAGKYVTEDKSKTDRLPKKQNYHGSVVLYDTWPINEVSLFHNAPKATWGEGSEGKGEGGKGGTARLGLGGGEQGLMSPSTHCRLSGRQFYRSKDQPTVSKY